MPSTLKRKKAADMSDSPPKRVTRARAKASNNGDSQFKTVKVMTPSAKVVRENREAFELGRAAKRKTRADDEREEPTDDPTKCPTLVAANPRARTKKFEQMTGDEMKRAEVVGAPRKARGRPPKINVVEEVKAEAPRLRTRTRSNPKPEGDTKVSTLEDEEPRTVRKIARTRAATGTAKTSASTTSSRPKSLAPKKKVKFEEDAGNDKENLPVERDRSAPIATGLRVKPIRKPAPIHRTPRARRAEASKTDSKCGPQVDIAIPLSPKKIKQIAKPSPISSEDELCGEKTPKRALSQSPVKPPPSTVRKFDGVATKLEFHAGNAPSSPTKPKSATVLQSPARRPPLLPFKDALKQSPKKGILGDPSVQPLMVASQSPLKSPLKSSPKRGLAPLSLKPSLLSQTPSKTSLLQSPARRLGGSPARNTATGPTIRTPDMVASGSSATPSSSPQEACSSPLRIVRTPGLYKVHTINKTGTEIGPGSISPDPIGQEEFITSCAARSPVAAKSRSGVHTGADESAVMKEEKVNYSTPEPAREHTSAAFAEGAQKVSELGRTTTPGPFTFTAPAFSLASPTFRCSVDESDSEDELASPQKVFLTTPLLKQRISLDDSDIEGVDLSLYSNKALPSSSGIQHSVAMTPLAAQMSAWQASSPEKRTAAAAMGLDQVMSPPVTISMQDSPPKASFFEDQMAVSEVQNESLVDIQPGDSEHDLVLVQASQDSQASEEYGDENTRPIDSQLPGIEDLPQDLTATCTPAKVFYTQPREIHTVSKVPLRPAADDTPSPLKVPRKRSKSLAGSSTFTVEYQRSRNSTLAANPLNEYGLISDIFTPVNHQAGNEDSVIETQRTLRKNAASNLLKGAVVFVDVHTTEGEDASGIFLELLVQMGARCVRQWSWNPRTSSAGTTQSPIDSEDGTTEAEVSNHKVGITHVVYKDGGKRTMEKLRASKGVVHCVGVGWVLE